MRRLTSVVACAGIALGVVACVAKVGGEGSGASDAPTTSRRAAADPARDPNQWVGHGNDAGEQRHSPLTQINVETIKDLKLAWSAEMPQRGQWQSTPIMVNGILYVTTPWSFLNAFNARTGEFLWSYNPQVPREMAATSLCCNNSNRGAVYWNGKIIWGTLDGRLIAVDAKKGTKLWETMTVNPQEAMSITGAPRVGRGVVVIGQGGGEYHQRGFFSGYDADTGKKLWKFFLVPGDPSKGPDGEVSDEMMAMAAATWKGEWWKFGGGATPWDGIVYDEESDLFIFGTGNGAPWPADIRSPGGGDNLFTASIVALHGKTGKYAWHYQTTPMESFDFDNTSPLTIADLVIDGAKKRVVMQIPKNGISYVIEAKTGKVISARLVVPFANWLTGFDKANNWKPILNPEANYAATGKGWYIIPFQTHVWAPQAFNPATGLIYVPIRNATYGMVAEAGAKMGNQLLSIVVGGPNSTPQVPRPNPAPTGSWLAAWNPATQTEAWRVPVTSGQTAGSSASGTLSTAGNLVFQPSTLPVGQGAPALQVLVAYRADTGEKVWHGETGVSIPAAAMSYQIDGEQYIAAAGGARVVAYKLGGTAQLPPPPPTVPQVLNPPANFGTEAQVAMGLDKYSQNCAICHDGQRQMTGAPDLRYSPFINTREAFKAVVIDGIKTENGMLSFAKALTVEETEAIRAHLTTLANTLKNQPAGGGGGRGFGGGGFGGGGGGGGRGGGPGAAPAAPAAPATPPAGLHQ